ncbi:MAG: type II secretion system GspH family protein [Synergistaceae bacterium]|jgi:prepilin-type N-terminal cleavage/methylation domain-containing protein|nr:type II secretion system GspH family protein [Synergistaceae bacterium]
MGLKIKKAFTFVELLISIVIVSILGGAALMALWFSIGSYSQMDDYTSMESEMEYAVQRLSRDFAMIGLGMPNNRKGEGSFYSTFSFSSSTSPVMAFFGSPADERWGGPVTVANATTGSVYSATTITNPGRLASSDLFGPGGEAYVGPELYYAWAVPTGVKAEFRTSTGGMDVKQNEVVVIRRLYTPKGEGVDGKGKDYLENFRYDGIDGHLDPYAGVDSVKRWVLFPTLRLPMLVEEDAKGWITVTEEGADWDTLVTRVAPESVKDVKGTVMGLDEIHLIQAAHLFRNGRNELVRVVFDTPSSFTSDVLAHNVVGLAFTYNPDSRLLTMYIAARGAEADAVGHSPAQPKSWPSWLPPIAAHDLRYRILTKNLTWRIRN